MSDRNDHTGLGHKAGQSILWPTEILKRLFCGLASWLISSASMDQQILEASHTA